MKHLTRVTVVALALSWAVAGAATLRAAEVVRGDVNGDGEVTPADGVLVAMHLFFGGHPLACEAQADFTGQDGVDVLDIMFIITHVGGDVTQYRFGRDPAYPPPPMVSCEVTPKEVAPLEDSAAEIKILEATAVGGDDAHAWITIGLSSSVPLWTFSGTVALGDKFHDTVSYSHDRIGYEVLLEPFRSFAEEHEFPGLAGELGVARVEDGRLHFAFLSQSITDHIGWVSPGEDVPALRLKVCLKAGTPAGAYPLVMERGEFTRAWTSDPELDGESGRVITPTLSGGTLTVDEEVGEGLTCHVRPLRDELDARFELIGTPAPPGGMATVTFVVHGDRACDGFGFTVLFDTEVLEATEIEKLYPPAPGQEPYRRENLEIDNVEGRLSGFVLFTYYDQSYTLPAHRDHRVLKFHFRVKPDVPFASTEVRFDDEGFQVFKAFADSYPPELSESFVFVNGAVNIIPDVTVFLRGDTNGDSAVDISDALTSLHYLYIGDRRPFCFDAADATDDGLLDVSDPIRTLDFLFLGGDPLPPPTGTPGKDPTPDGMTCFTKR